MMEGVAVSCAAVLVGAVVGAFVVPWAANALLRRVYARASSWWWDSLEAFRRLRKRDPAAVPSSASPGEEGAVGMWREAALRDAAAGLLTSERVQALADAGIKVEHICAACTEDERRQAHEFSPAAWHRVVLGACGAAGIVWACEAACRSPTMLGAGAGTACTAALLCTAVLAVIVAAVCDIQARVIPLETCGIIAVVGALYQLVVHGMEGFAAGLLMAVLVWVGCAVANRLCRIRHPAGAVGRGDMRCMAALSLASGAGAFVGFVACYACAGLYAAVGCLSRRFTLCDGIPMAPFLAVWLVCGVTAVV